MPRRAQTSGMGLAAVVLVGALLVGRLAGGSLTGLGDLRVRRAALVLAAGGAQAAGALLLAADGGTTAPYVVGLVASVALVGVFLAGNRRLPGAPLFALGLAANVAVVVANGAMPVSLAAAQRAGADTTAIASGSDPRHEVAGAGTRASVLGDVVPLPLPVRPAVVSPGDVLVAAGIAELVVVGMRRRRVMGWPQRPRRRTTWRRRPASGAPARRARPTTASVPTPDGG
jgi:hypothetical protein